MDSPGGKIIKTSESIETTGNTNTDSTDNYLKKMHTKSLSINIKNFLNIDDHKFKKNKNSKQSEKIDPIVKKLQIKRVLTESEDFFNVKYSFHKHNHSEILPPIKKLSHSKMNPTEVFNWNKTNKGPIYTFSSINKLKKVDNFFKTDLKIRQSINKEIKSKINLEKSNSHGLNDEELIFTRSKEKEDIIRDLYNMKRIQLKGPCIKKINEEEIHEIKKTHPDIISKPNYMEINGRFTFPEITQDSKITYKIYKDNIAKLNLVINGKSSFYSTKTDPNL